jgi:hypothetical protein
MEWLRKRKRSQGPVVSISRPRTDAAVNADDEAQPSQNRSIHISRQDHNRRLGQSSAAIQVQEDLSSLPNEQAEELTPWSPSFFDETPAQPLDNASGSMPDQQDEGSVRGYFFVTCHIPHFKYIEIYSSATRMAAPSRLLP